MLFRILTSTFVVLAVLLLPASVRGEDRTSFQAAAPYSPPLDIASDQAMIYGVNDSFAARAESWKSQGYRLGFMTGISWGGYDAYYGASELRVNEEIQTDKNGKRFMHGHSTTVGYNVPTPAYLEFLKEHINPAIDAGIDSFYLEEPEYWANTGWSEGFKRAWQTYYGAPWQAPDSSPEAQFKASRLKYELYFNALSEIFQHIKDRAKAQGREAKCYVPTHSLINYAHWRIVSPESHLMDLETADGYIAQVWTGTARTPNRYQGVRKERTFETAFLEYGQMLSMVRPTGRTVWFLADPVEDNPDHTWTDYEYNYKLTLTASLFWPEAYQYEVMPWPSRIFNGTYPADDGSGSRVGISAAYTQQLLAILNALNDMKQDDVTFDTGSRGVGLVISDTLMFQRANPEPSDSEMAMIYGLALPLLKQGVPVEPVQLETILTPGALNGYRVLLLTYEGQKPLRPEYHDALATWVREGGALIIVGDGSDPYHAVPEWWNQQGATTATPYTDLYARLGISALKDRESAGSGSVRTLARDPRDLQNSTEGAEAVRGYVRQALEERGIPWKTQHYLSLRRGPYRIAMALEESVPGPAYTISGPCLDLFQAGVPLIDEKVLAPGTPALLYDLAWARQNYPGPRVLAASARIRNETLNGGGLEFTARGPVDSPASVVIQLDAPPSSVRIAPDRALTSHWDGEHGLLRLEFANSAEDVKLAVTF